MNQAEGRYSLNFSELIKNKTVCFVGACPILQGKKHGRFIDSFDTVIKTNGSMFLSGPDYFNDYGKRKDVLYFNNQFQREMRSDLLQYDFIKNDVKFIRFKGISDDLLNQYKKKIYAENMDLQPVIKTVKSALMGVFIINEIIKNKPVTFYLTGIDFFSSKKQVFEKDNYREYLDGYLPEKIINQGNIINQGKTADGHNQYENTKFIYNLYKKGRVQMPEFIEEIMLKIIENKGYINECKIYR